MKKLILLLMMLAVMAGTAYAQVSGYVFSYSAGTYEEITGGTVLGTATVGGTGTNSLDGGFYTGTPISFPFAYNGLPYTELAVSCDGYIVFGGTAAMGYFPISNTTVCEGAVSILGRDLQGNVEEGNLGEVRYETLGDAPNRVYVIQWKNFRRYAGVGENYNFQIRLHETTDVIEFIYGSMVVNYTGSTHPEVGLRGLTNADYNNRVVTTDWAASTAGTVNTAQATLSTTVFPASGTTYSFTLTVSSGPNPPVMVYPANNGWIFPDGALKWTPAGGYPSSFNVYLGTSSPPPFEANVTSTSYTPTLAENTIYHWNIEAQNNYGVAAATERSFKTLSPSQMCESFESTVFPPTGWTNPGSWSRSTSNKFHLTASAYKSASTTPAILSTPKVTITPASILEFYYRPGSLTGYGRVQIVYSPDRVTWTPIGPVISMPTAYEWNSASVALGSLSGNYFLGFQVYSTVSTAGIYIDHVAGPDYTSEPPGPVTLTAPANEAVDVNPRPVFTWTAPTQGGVPAGYRIYCDTYPDPVTLLGSTTEFTFTTPVSLEFGVTYYWKVVAFNGAGNSSPNTIWSFTVWDDPTVNTFPWSESFDGTTFAPIGWENFRTAGTGNPGTWNRVTAGTLPTCTTHSGAGMARYNSYSYATGTRGELVTPPLNVGDGDTYKLKFWMFRDSGYPAKTQEVVNVYVNTEPLSAGGTLLGTISRYYDLPPVEPTANQWYEYIFTFTGTEADKYVIFEAVSEYGNNMFIDDVSVQLIDPPAAPIPTYPANYATGLPQAGFDFTWAPDLVNGDAPSYYVLYLASSEETIFDEYVYDNITTTSFNPVTSPGDPITYSYGMDYYWTVQAVNSSGDAVFDPIFKFTIETGLLPPVVTITLSSTGTVDLNWSAVTSANSYKIYASNDPYTAEAWTWLHTTGSLSYTYTGTESYKFFKVFSSTDLP